jgi:hypothetical protein
VPRRLSRARRLLLDVGNARVESGQAPMTTSFHARRSTASGSLLGDARRGALPAVASIVQPRSSTQRTTEADQSGSAPHAGDAV